LTAEDFTKHFSKQFVVTDVKFIPHRRIGYVGYKSPEDAARAVKYHNKSFIRMSRIGVELARSVEEQSALRAGHNTANATNRTYGGNKADNPTSADVGGEKKRKRESIAGDGDKAKLQEFLEVMQPPSKSKTWENQDAIIARTNNEPTTTTIGKGEHEARSEDEYEPVPKKQKSEPKRNRKVEQGFEAPQAEAAKPQQDDAIGIAEQGSEVAVQEPLDTMQPASDANWLRSRTSRLLGLVDDDDALGQNNLPEDSEGRKAELLSISEQVEDVGNADASVQTYGEAKQADDTTVALPFHSEEGSPMSNGRIFVRNLTYTTTEEELRHHFENGAYGTIEEVSADVAMPSDAFDSLHNP
jgi:multiple RNA-binding domain-containing protein 1